MKALICKILGHAEYKQKNVLGTNKEKQLSVIGVFNCCRCGKETRREYIKLKKYSI